MDHHIQQRNEHLRSKQGELVTPEQEAQIFEQPEAAWCFWCDKDPAQASHLSQDSLSYRHNSR